MTAGSFKDIEKLESDLWEAADNLRANSKLTSSDYFMPARPRSRTCADASMHSPRPWRGTLTSTPRKSRRSPMP